MDPFHFTCAYTCCCVLSGIQLRMLGLLGINDNIDAADAVAANDEVQQHVYYVSYYTLPYTIIHMHVYNIIVTFSSRDSLRLPLFYQVCEELRRTFLQLTSKIKHNNRLRAALRQRAAAGRCGCSSSPRSREGATSPSSARTRGSA